MSGINVDVLKAIANATAASSAFYVSADDGKPMLQHTPPLIQVNMDMKDEAGKVAARVTDAGAQYLAALGKGNEHTKPVHNYEVQTGGLVLPKIERKGFGGGAGAPTKYPFETMPMGGFFFVANSDVEKGDAVKTMGSAAGSANQRFAEEVKNADGTTRLKTVTRAKRGEGNKAVKDPQTGKNVMETVNVPEKRMTKRFVVRPVKAGVKYGDWTAPSDGAVIQRVELKADEAPAA